MKVIGIRCTKDQIQWVVVRGESRGEAVVLDHDEATAPVGDRAEQLAWASKELIEVLGKHQPERVSLRVAEAGQSVSAAILLRAEMDGVMQAAASSRGLTVQRFSSATIRSTFSAKNKIELDRVMAGIPCVAAMTKSRQEQTVVAVAALPSE